SDQENIVAHTLHKFPGRYDSQLAIVLLEAQYGSPLFISPAVPHKMHDLVTLARHEMAQLLDPRRAGSLQGDALWYFLDNIPQAHPFAIDIERLHLMTEGIGGN